MTFEEAKMTIYENVVYACEEAGFTPMTIKLVKDACDTVIALAEQADTPQTERTCNNCGRDKAMCLYCEERNKWTPQTDCCWK